MITIYSRGCVSCGAVARYRKRVEAYARAKGQVVQVINTLYDKNGEIEHQNYLSNVSGYGDYEPIVVEDGKVSKLRLFNL